MAAKHPKFTRQNRAVDKRVGKAWRKPRGIDNKQRVKLAWAGASPAIGYRGKKEERGMRNGKYLIVVCNEKDIAAMDGKAASAYISRTVGKKNRVALIEACKKAGIKVLNAGRPQKSKVPAAAKEAKLAEEAKAEKK